MGIQRKFQTNSFQTKRRVKEFSFFFFFKLFVKPAPAILSFRAIHSAQVFSITFKGKKRKFRKIRHLQASGSKRKNDSTDYSSQLTCQRQFSRLRYICIFIALNFLLMPNNCSCFCGTVRCLRFQTYMQCITIPTCAWHIQPCQTLH